MLILRRKKNESILIGENIRITVVDCAPDGVRLAIDAPRQMSILREELSQAEAENKSSLAPGYRAILDLQDSLLDGLSSGRSPQNPADTPVQNPADPASSSEKK